MATSRLLDAPDPDELTIAAGVLRSAGYAVVSKVEADNWNRWLAEANTGVRASHDEASQLIQAYGALLHRVTEQLAPSRPLWLRDARSWWNRLGWTKPVVHGVLLPQQEAEAS